MEKAYKMFLRMNRSSMDRALVSMVNTKIGTALQQDPAATASLPTGYAAVDKARDMLNNMIDEAIMKRELEGVRCNEFDTKQIKILKELEMDIAYVNSEASAAKSEVLRCQEIIQVVEEVKLPTNRQELEQHNERCRVDKAALQQQLAIVRADIQVMRNILGMVCAEDLRTAAPAAASLLQSDESSSEGSLVQCTSCTTGAQAVWLRHSKIQSLLASIRSKEVKDYIQDHLMHEFDDQKLDKIRSVFLQDEELNRNLRSLPDSGINIPALGSRFNGSNPPPRGGTCNEQMTG